MQDLKQDRSHFQVTLEKATDPNRPVLILVEGIDLRAFFQDFASKEGLFKLAFLDFKKSFPKQGNNGGYIPTPADLHGWIPVVKSQFDRYTNTGRCPTALGVIADAEYDNSAEINSIKKAFENSNLLAPKDELEISRGSPSTAFLLLHSQESSGEKGCFEHVLLDSLHDDAAERKECAEQFLACIEQAYSVQNENHRAKIKAKSIVTSINPSLNLRNSANKSSLWDWGKPSLARVAKFLKEMNDLAT